MPRYFDLHVSILGIKPEIWRGFLLAADSTFAELHGAIQDAVGWKDAHLFAFREKDSRRTIARSTADDSADAPTASDLKLVSYFKTKGQRCLYVYDFGDKWEHLVEFHGVIELPERFTRRLLDGARACPLEDCGGVWGYENCVAVVGMFKDDIKKLGDGAEETEERKEWIGDWEPEAFDLSAVKKEFDV